MNTDRDEALRRAELLLRQGQLDPAIAEYVRLVEAHPNDLALLNTLGDLFVRAGSSDRALPLYLRVADAYMHEGFYARAAGYYKKVLKFTPADEQVILKLAETCIRQGLRADARKYLHAVANARHRRRDFTALAPVLRSLDDLDPTDFTTRLAAVRALVPLQPVDAFSRLKRIAESLDELERGDEAVAVWRDALKLDASDRVVAVRLARAAMADGQPRQAIELLGALILEDAGDIALLAQAYLDAGEEGAARELLDARMRARPEIRGSLADLLERLRGAGDHESPTAAQVEPVFEAEPAVVDVLEVTPLAAGELDSGLDDATLVEPLLVLPIPDDDEPLTEPPAPWAMIEMEVDLTDRLDAAAMEAEAVLPPRAHPDAAPATDGHAAPAQELGAAFATLRTQAVGEAADLVGLGRTYVSAGLHDQAIEAFVTAAHDPSQRYDASVALAELYDGRRDRASAVEWLERAAESAPSVAKRGAVLYRLGVLLEGIGEPGRALGVLLELKTMAPHFRDVGARVARLEAAQSGGGPFSR